MKIKEIGDIIPKNTKQCLHCFDDINIYLCYPNANLYYFYPKFILNLTLIYPIFLLIFILHTYNYKLMTGGLACPHTAKWVL